MRKFLFVIIVALAGNVSAAETDYLKSDSIKVETLLREASEVKGNLMLHFARRLKGIPYVGKTLEKNASERLVVNLRQMDCTTYVETVLALVRCAGNKLTRFEDFCNCLRMIRYRKGKVSYADRLHYFTAWIADNTELGYVKEVSKPNPPFTAMQKISVNYMTAHTWLYPMMHKNAMRTDSVRDMEKGLDGREYPYIPKASIANTALFRNTIHDGDIIAILTNRKGLDTSHIGIAVWHKDGLHMLNASSVHHKVVEEPMTLWQYMQKHPSQTGIRIIKVIGK